MLNKLIPHTIKAQFFKWIAYLKRPRFQYGFKDGSSTFYPNVIWSDTCAFYHEENLTVKNHVYFGHYTFVDATGGIDIGEGAQLGHWVGVFTHSSHRAIRLYGEYFYQFSEKEKKDYYIKPVKIGRYVFIGSQSLVMPGVTIADGALIMPKTVVTHDIAARSIVSGNPGKVIGTVDKLDERSLKQHPELKEFYFDKEFLSTQQNI